MSIWISKIRTPAVALAGILMLAANAMAGVVFTVDSIADDIDNDTSDGICHTAANTCTLRAAVMSANKAGGTGATIMLPAGTYVLLRPPTADANDDSSGSVKLLTPVIGTPSITIVGAGAGVTVIDANMADRVLVVGYLRSANISGVTFRNGLAPGDGGGIYNAGSLLLTGCNLSNNSAADGANGGGIYSTEGLTFSQGTLSTNHAHRGAGIYSTFYVSVSDCSLSGNTTDFLGSGGGLYLEPGGSAVVDHCTLDGNTANLEGGGISSGGSLAITYSTLSGNTVIRGAGGGIVSTGTLTLEHSTVSGNAAAYGGGITSYGTSTVSQSTISGNAANPYAGEPGKGGGIFAHDVLTVTNSTIASNTAVADGGGIYNFVEASANINIYSSTIAGNDAAHTQISGVGGGVFVYGSGGNGVNVYNTVVAGNTVNDTPIEDDCDTPNGATLKTHARNLFGSTDGCTITQISGSYATLDPPASLGGLRNNGGPTQTIALLAGSNAIDGTSVTGSLCYDGSGQIMVDQRGYPRGGVCDVGAFEYDDIFVDGFQ